MSIGISNSFLADFRLHSSLLIYTTGYSFSVDNTVVIFFRNYFCLNLT